MLESIRLNSSAPQPETSTGSEPEAKPGDLPAVRAQVKWFDATRGFGFLISDEMEGDILIHFSVLREHGRRSLPEGASVQCIPARLERGLQARKILSIEASEAAPPRLRRSPSPTERADRQALAVEAGEFEPVEVKWFNRSKGYGFLVRVGVDAQDVFVHMETARQSGVGELQQGELLEARIAESSKGLTAVELRIP
jgi:CspA family cold shock protein